MEEDAEGKLGGTHLATRPLFFLPSFCLFPEETTSSSCSWETHANRTANVVGVGMHFLLTSGKYLRERESEIRSCATYILYICVHTPYYNVDPRKRKCQAKFHVIPFLDAISISEKDPYQTVVTLH